MIERASPIDVLIVNLAAPNHYGTPVTELEEPAWRDMFSLLVHPLHGLVRHALPQMIERQKGKIVVFGSATHCGRWDGLPRTARRGARGYPTSNRRASRWRGIMCRSI